MTNRSQCVRINDVVSKECSITYGVPQGSVIGPSLFLCYINELCNLDIPQCKIQSYADDTTLTFFGDSWDEVYSLAQSGFNVVCHWLAANSLTLNADKTKYIAFSLRNTSANTSNKYKIIAHSCFYNNCSCPEIALTKNIKYLGIIIDKNLNFGDHINYLVKKIRKLTYVFKQLRNVADKKLILNVYVSLCESVLCYCISSWGGASKTNLIKLERAQRLILKISLKKPRLYSTEILYRDAQVLTVRQLFIMNIILRQHSILQYTDQHGRANTRRQHTVCQTQAVKTSFAQRFFNFLSSRLYNETNKIHNIYHLTKCESRKIIKAWLLSLNYEKTEKLVNYWGLR